MQLLIIQIILVLVAAVSAGPKRSQRIVGGAQAHISQYPHMASLLFSWGTTGHRQECAGVIITTRSILTAAHCTFADAPARWRSRVGSTFADSGGVVHDTARIINHPQFDGRTLDNDVAIIHTRMTIVFSTVVQSAQIAGSDYNLLDNQVVWAAGWGYTSVGAGALPSEHLQHVELRTVNQQVCRERYASINLLVTNNMLCSGWLDVGGRDQCFKDSGGPLYHNGNVVGICSWGPPGNCGSPTFPGVNARVTQYTNWIVNNA